MVGSLAHAADHELSRVHCLATKVATTSYLVISNARKRRVASGTGTEKLAGNKKTVFFNKKFIENLNHTIECR